MAENLEVTLARIEGKVDTLHERVVGQINGQHDRITRLESAQRFVARTAGGAVITILVGALFAVRAA